MLGANIALNQYGWEATTLLMVKTGYLRGPNYWRLVILISGVRSGSGLAQPGSTLLPAFFNKELRSLAPTAILVVCPRLSKI